MDVSLFLHYARLRLRERMEYRAAYVLGIVAQILGWGGDYAVIFLLLSRFQSINGWTWPQVAFLFSLELFSYALGASFAFSPMVELEAMVVQGQFEIILVIPLEPLQHLAARKYNLGYLAHVIISGAFLLWSVNHLGVALGPLLAAYIVLSLISATCLQAAALIALGSSAILVVRSNYLFLLYYTLKGFIVYPITVYHVSIQWLITLVIPIAFINYYPASLLLGKGGAVLPTAAGWIAPLVGPIALLATYHLFRAAVKRYQGAGG